MSIELMLKCDQFSFSPFSRYNNTMDGSIFVFFIMTVAAAEVAVGWRLSTSFIDKSRLYWVNELNPT